MNRKTLPGSKAMMLVGVLLCVFGVLLLLSPAAVGAAVIRLVALVLVITGVAQLIQGFRGGTFVHKAAGSILGAIVAGVGVLVWLNPQLGSSFLTSLLMMFFVVQGLWKMNSAMRFRGMPGSGLMLFAAIMSLIFVFLLWQQWPLAGAWAIGVLVGLDLLLTGITMIVLAKALRKSRSSNYVDTISL
jgi:uncharacterized membrane protein HdeD (DUF308 family)